MATSWAIAAVTDGIRRLLEPALDSGVDDVKVYQASDFQHDETGRVLSLYLYRVAANTNRRTLPPRQEADGRRLRPALAVDLFYLISAWGSSVQGQQELLGEALRALEDTPTLPASLLNGGAYPATFRDDEAVELVYDPLSLTDMIALWDLLKPGVRPSASYVARAVAIESEIEIFVGDPVVERRFDYLKPVEEPIFPREGAMIANAVLVETVTIFGPLGLRFWDAATGRAIGDGLAVRATPERENGEPLHSPLRLWVQAMPNRSGVYAFHRLPGWSTTPFEESDRTRTYIIEVRDELRRILPFRFTAHPSREVVTDLESAVDSPLEPSGGIPLFSAAARPIPAGVEVIRAELRDKPSGAPAAFARVRAAILKADNTEDRSEIGVADEQGRVMIVVPHPTPVEAPIGSPLSSPLSAPRTPLAAQTWDVAITVQYCPPADPAGPMDLDFTLAKQLDAKLDEDAAGPFSTGTLSFTLAHGLGLAKPTDDPTPRWEPHTPVIFVQPSGCP